MGGFDLYTVHGKCESLFDIANEIVALLDTAAQANQVIADAEGSALRRRNGAMGHAGWELSQRLDAAEGLCEREEAQGREEGVCRRVRRVRREGEIRERRVFRRGGRGGGAG